MFKRFFFNRNINIHKNNVHEIRKINKNQKVQNIKNRNEIENKILEREIYKRTSNSFQNIDDILSDVNVDRQKELLHQLDRIQFIYKGTLNLENRVLLRERILQLIEIYDLSDKSIEHLIDYLKHKKAI